MKPTAMDAGVVVLVVGGGGLDETDVRAIVARELDEIHRTERVRATLVRVDSPCATPVAEYVAAHARIGEPADLSGIREQDAAYAVVVPGRMCPADMAAYRNACAGHARLIEAAALSAAVSWDDYDGWDL